MPCVRASFPPDSSFLSVLLMIQARWSVGRCSASVRDNSLREPTFGERRRWTVSRTSEVERILFCEAWERALGLG